MEEDKKINMALDDIIMLEKIKENNKSNLGFTPIGSWQRYTSIKQNAVTDPNRIQNLRYTHTGPIARRNYKRYGALQSIPQYSNFKKSAPVSQYLRNRVRYATQFLNRTQQAQRQVPQRPFSNLFVRNRLLALKRLQEMRTLKSSQIAARALVNSDEFSVVIPNELAMKQRGQNRGRGSISQLTVRNMEKFNALSGSIGRSRNGSIYSAGYRSRRSRSASVGHNSRPGTPVRNYAGSDNEWNVRPGNSEISGYSLKPIYSRFLNYGVQRKIAMLQGKAVPVDTRGRPVIICNGLGLDFITRPVASAKTLHERIALMLQTL